MSYELEFKKQALKEWKKLAPEIRQQFKNKLTERLEELHVPASKITGGKDLYKIKFWQIGYRLVYKVNDNVITVTVLAVGRRVRNNVYIKAQNRGL